MENLSPTQEKSSKTLYDKKQQAEKAIKDNANYIYIALMIIADILCSLLYVADGSIGLSYPKTILGWVLWAIQIFIQVFLGVMILCAFRNQGIKIGHDEIKDVYDKYLLSLTQTSKKPRSLKEYKKRQGLKDALTKSIIYILVSVFTLSVIISANWNNLLSLVINIILAIGFGIKALIDAEEYVVTELVIWYRNKIAEVTQKKGARKEEKQCEIFMKESQN